MDYRKPVEGMDYEIGWDKAEPLTFGERLFEALDPWLGLIALIGVIAVATLMIWKR